MTPLLLTLASLTPGDGGPGGGAAREAVVWKLGEGFSGYIRLPGGQVRFELLKEAARATVARVSVPVRSPGLRRRPKGFPGWRGNG